MSAISTNHLTESTFKLYFKSQREFKGIICRNVKVYFIASLPWQHLFHGLLLTPLSGKLLVKFNLKT